jgi:ParB family chromosome partitioning protein
MSAVSTAKRARLGKGLGALLGEYLPQEGESAPEEGVLRMVPVGALRPNPFQPRREFAPEQLAELEASIRENGLLQPLIVRAIPDTSSDAPEWELVAGERRLRVTRNLGWKEVPVVVRSIDDRAMLVLAIVENVQRAGLSPMEEAAGYRRLVDEFGFTQAEVAQSVGRERSTVANLLRLLHLPDEVQRMVGEGKLSMGHARALLGLGNEDRMLELANIAVQQGLSVRAVEDRVRGKTPAPGPGEADGANPTEAHLRRLEEQIERVLGTAARIRVGARRSGRIEILVRTADDFDRVLERLLGQDAA